MRKKISAVYKITNTVTGDFYIGSSKNIKNRWRAHKSPSKWNKCPNNPLYLDFQNYGVNKFVFEILEKVETDKLKEKEQQFIEILKPTYNNNRANGFDVERYKESHRKYNNKYYNQLCLYNGETLTLNTLRMRFTKSGIAHPTKEAKKYLIKKESKTPIEFYDVYP